MWSLIPSGPPCLRSALRIKKNTTKVNTLGIWTEYIKLWECDVPGTCSNKLVGTEHLHRARSGYTVGDAALNKVVLAHETHIRSGRPLLLESLLESSCDKHYEGKISCTLR